MKNLFFVTQYFLSAMALLYRQINRIMKNKTVEITSEEMPFEPISIDEVATLTALKKSYLYQLVHRREIPVHTRARGRRLIFNKNEIIKWMTAIRRSTIEELADNIGYL